MHMETGCAWHLEGLEASLGAGSHTLDEVFVHYAGITSIPVAPSATYRRTDYGTAAWLASIYEQTSPRLTSFVFKRL